MKKMKMETVDLIDERIDKLEELFPNCIKESRDKNGVIKKVVDFDLLQQMLSKETIEADETFEFSWVGKKASIAEANRSIRKTLRPCINESADWDNTENLYIKGDNLDVLKIMQESYLGKVNMIYIDPPYNTGNDFVYSDSFSQSLSDYDEQSGTLDEEGKKLFKNTDSNGRFHSDWCSMIYPRLLLARNLMADNGVIFISIDDNEYANLKRMCDEVFGASNFIASIVRNTNSSKNQSLFVSVSHEYCLVYAKNIEILKNDHKDNKWSVKKNNVDEYISKVKQLKKQGLSDEEITEELKSLTNYPRFIDFTNYWYFDDKGLYCKDNLGGVSNGNMTPIMNPLTKKMDPIPPGGFRYNPKKMNELIEEGKIHFHKDGSLPRVKRYLLENMNQRPKSIMSDDQRPDYSLMKEFNTPFDNPKQLSFMKRICGIMDKDAIFLDFFSGSSTTAHAVMELNSEDGGSRKFIMVQLPEECSPKSEAYKAGYKTICDIGEERIRKAAKRIKDKVQMGVNDLDLGFRVFKLDSSNMNDVYYSTSEYNQDMISKLESNVKSDRNDLDLLFGCLLEWGLPISMPYKSEEIYGFTIHTYNDGDLIACFEKNISDDVIKEIARRKPLRVVFRDDSFEDSPSKINVAEIFKMLSPDTKIKVL